MKKPNFFIIGAPKCGTTSMSEWLGEHPQIFMSIPKEPCFFSTDINVSWQVKNLDEFLLLFKNSNDQYLAVGEASTTYLQSYDAVKNILEFNSDAKFIVMLRNPIDMAQSWHGHMKLALREFLDNFEEDWNKQRACEFESFKLDCHGGNPDFLRYDKVCKLGEQVRRLLQSVDANSVLFLVMDDLISDPLHEYRRILEFLDVPWDGKCQFPVHNSATQPRYKLIRNLFSLLADMKARLGITRNFGVLTKIYEFNKTPHETQPLRHEFRQELIEFFKEDIQLLSSLIGRDLSHWLR